MAHIIYTTAPAAYDYETVKVIETFEVPQIGSGEPIAWRKLELLAPDEYTRTYQCQRYGSGNYPVAEEDPRDHYKAYLDRQAREDASRKEAETFLATASIEELREAMRTLRHPRIRFDEYRDRIKEKEREDKEVAIQSEYEDWCEHPVALIQNVLILPRYEKCDSSGFSNSALTNKLNEAILLTNLSVQRDRDHVMMQADGGEAFFTARGFMGSTNKVISPLSLSKFLDKGWAVEVKEIPPARLHKSLDGLFSVRHEDELYWLETHSWDREKVTAYQEDGIKVRGNSKTMKALLEMRDQWNKFVPAPVEVEYDC